MNILVLAEYHKGRLSQATLCAVTAAKQLGEVTLLVAGQGVDGIAVQAAAVDGVSAVLQADNATYADMLPENLSALLVDIGREYTHILAAATTTGKDVMPRVAALLDSAQISDVIAIESADTFVRPIYAGNAIATEQSDDAIKVLTIRSTGFDAAAVEGGSAAINILDNVHDLGVSNFVKDEVAESARPELTAASVIISGGRAMKNGENFKLLNGIADKLGAAIGASRAAVDEGFVPNDWQVGQTGKIVAPDLYIACGISGAIQHIAGIKDSKVIVAINTDPDAPIFEVADYGLVADLFEAVPELEAAL